MKAVDKSGSWFAATLFVLFGLLAVIFFGRAATDANFWISLISFFPAIVVASLMRDPISKLGRLPRMMSWFTLGVTAGVSVALIGGRDFDLVDFIWFGIALAAFDFIGDRFFSKQEVDRFAE